MTLTYPLPDDYSKAVQNPSHVFAPTDLRRATFPAPRGRSVPQAVAGSNAVVFRARVEGRDEAVRFFTRPASSSKERYSALAGVVASGGLATALPAARWIDPGVHVNGIWWPLIRMDWVPGTPLDEYVETLVEQGSTAGLASLADSWRAFIGRLQTADVAHGDLQHGNVLVANGQFVLVDLDGVWLPSLAHLAPPEESGHVNYQPPDPAVRWGRYMDTFPALVIHLSLRALSYDLSLWDKYWNAQNLIFSREDFAPPFETDLWHDLAAIIDPGLTSEVTLLRGACTPGSRTDRPLDALLLAAPTTSTTASSTTTSVTPWWTETGTRSSRQTSVTTTTHRTPQQTKQPLDLPPWRPSRVVPPPAPDPDPDWWKRPASPSTGPATETRAPGKDAKRRLNRRVLCTISAIAAVLICLAFAIPACEAAARNGTTATQHGTTSSVTYAAYPGQYPTYSVQDRVDNNSEVEIECISTTPYWLRLGSGVWNSSGYFVPAGDYIQTTSVAGVAFSALPRC